MLEHFRFHHIGYATDSIADFSTEYIGGGYCMGTVFTDNIQRVKACFLYKKDNPVIELVEPLDEKSSINKILKKNGVCPYHICYETDSINADFDLMCERGYTPLFRPVKAAAFDNRLICYFYKKEIGFIELLNSKMETVE